MADVFLSYARRDHEKAEKIRALLHAHGLSVFFDVEGLDGGDAFPDVLDHQVKTAGAVLGLWSPWALSRPWVRIECRIAMDRGVLIPVAIEPVNALTDVPAAFYDVQQIDLSDFNGDPADPEWRKVVKSIGRTLKRPDLAGPEPDVASRTKHTDRRAPAAMGWIAGGVIAALLVAGGLAAWRPWQAPPPAAAAASTPAPGLSSIAAGAMPTGAASTSNPAALLADLKRIDFRDPSANAKMFIEQLLQTYSLDALQRAADGPDSPEAQMMMGTAYNFGLYVPADLAKAAALYSRSCDAGIAAGCNGAASLYGAGQGVQQDEVKARVLFRKGCDGSYMPSCSSLALMMTLARGGPIDYAAARALHRKACDGKYLIGCSNLGLMELNGQGAPMNVDNAKAMFEHACDGADAMGCGNLGFIYANGAPGIERDYAKSAKLYEKSCSGGFVQACSLLGFHLANGLGVPKDLPRARTLLTQGCNMQDAFGCSTLKTLPPP